MCIRDRSRIAARTFLDALGRTAHGEPTADVLHRATGTAGRAVADAARRAGLLDDMGTTLVAAVLERGGLSWVSVGDSGVFLVRAGEIRQLNRPHTLGARLDRAVAEGRMDAADAAAHAQRHALTSFLGKPTLDEVDGNAAPLPLQADDVVVVCSDGLFGTLSLVEIGTLVVTTPTASAASALVDAALAKGRPRQDNVSVAVVRGVEAAVAPPPSGTMPPGRRAPLWQPLAALALLAVALAALWWWRGPQPDAPAAVRDTLTTTGTATRPDSSALDSLASDSATSGTGGSDTLRRPAPGVTTPLDTARVVRPAVPLSVPAVGTSRPPPR